MEHGTHDLLTLCFLACWLPSAARLLVSQCQRL